MASIANKLPESAASPETRAFPWTSVAWFLALVALCYAPMLQRLALQWSTDEDVGHGFFVPVVAAYIAWQRRDELLARRWTPSYWGIPLILWGAFQSWVGTLGAELFLQRTAILFTLAGIVTAIGGFALLRALSFPLALLIFMVPIPAVIYGQITLPLQLFASSVAETSLNLIGIPVIRDGNVLELPSQKLSVVEACSGIRSLLSLSFLSLVYAYFFDKKVWMRGALLVATVPIAIIANAGRVTITGVLSEYSPDLAKGVFHELEGWVIFVVALLMLVLTHQVINRLWTRFGKEKPGAVSA
ncbi:MAG: exosortase/archaeosortase family protein [Bryobacteraceae bacterium]|nr:exosortase/archaeosortase family protein [Bryobacteraceae bacterium]